LIRAVAAAALSLVWVAAMSAAQSPAAGDACGEVITIQTHSGTTTRYALASPRGVTGAGEPMALVLLVGGGGHLALDDKGCPRALKGNSLVRSLPNFHQAGFVTALADSPSDYTGEDGLAGFRTAPEHADDLGRVIADVRARTKAPVWLVGTSRGAISAANAASRLSGPSAPDGLVLTSALMSGGRGGAKPWLTQSVFDLPLEAIRMPVLVVGHAADTASVRRRASWVASRRAPTGPASKSSR
jgi:hypothetical protein